MRGFATELSASITASLRDKATLEGAAVAKMSTRLWDAQI